MSKRWPKDVAYARNTESGCNEESGIKTVNIYIILFLPVLYTQSAVGRQLGGLSNLIASAQNGEAPRLFASLALLIAASPLS